MMRDFLKAEDGAVTVDWVVMTAAVVGLGIATAGVVQTGLTGSSGTLSENIGEIVCDETGGNSDHPTGCFNATQTVAAGAPFGNLLSRVTQASFSTTITLDPNDEGIIFEAGNEHGMILYVHDGTLYLQNGDGGYSDGDPLDSSGRIAEIAWDIPSDGGTFTIEGSANGSADPANPGKTALYIDGELIGVSNFRSNLIAGLGGQGANAGVVNSVPENRGGYTSNSGSTHGHPAASDVEFYVGKITDDVVLN